MKAILRNGKQLLSQEYKLTLHSEEKVALLFLGVKFFFLPTMLNFFIQNWIGLRSYSWNAPQFPWYSFLFVAFFTIDTFIFTLGYSLESKWLKNTVRSVEPTFFGWAVALICYPPFNSMVGNYVPWGANDHVLFWNPYWTAIFRIIILSLMLIYVWATVVLGLKSSNLTNRGIVSKFPYSIIRHPAYVSKNLMWWITLLPVMSWPFFLGMFFWSMIYFFRAMTEERHLRQDKEYVEYCQKVKWRFIPYVV